MVVMDIAHHYGIAMQRTNLDAVILIEAHLAIRCTSKLSANFHPQAVD